MSTAVVIFVKTPGLSPIKTRLAAAIGPERASEFFLRSLQATEAVVTQAIQENSRLVPYWAVAEQEGLSHPLWASYQKIWQGHGTLGEKLSGVYDELLRTHESIIFIGGDAPIISPTHLLKAESLLAEDKSSEAEAEFVLGPAHDGGFYLFGGRVAVPRSAWTNVSYSEASTTIELADQIQGLGHIEKLESLPDVDTLNDLLRLPNQMREQKQNLPEQEELLRWLESIAVDLHQGAFQK